MFSTFLVVRSDDLGILLSCFVTVTKAFLTLITDWKDLGFQAEGRISFECQAPLPLFWVNTCKNFFPTMCVYLQAHFEHWKHDTHIDQRWDHFMALMLPTVCGFDVVLIPGSRRKLYSYSTDMESFRDVGKNKFSVIFCLHWVALAVAINWIVLMRSVLWF